MKTPLYDNKDFLAGLLYLVVASVALYVGKDFPVGSALRMGPGYFPRVLGLLLLAFGLFVMIRGLRKPERVGGRWGWRPLFFVTVAIAAFGFAMDRFGLVPAITVMLFLAAFGGSEFKFTEVVVLAVVLNLLAVAIFIWGLNLPYQLFGSYN